MRRDEKEALVTEILERVAEISHFNVEADLVREDVIGTAFGFRDMEVEATEAVEAADELVRAEVMKSGRRLGTLPVRQLHSLNGAAGGILGPARAIRDWDVEQSEDPRDQRQILRNQFEGPATEFANVARQALSTLATSDGGLRESTAIVENALSEIRNNLEESGRALEGIRSISADAGVSTEQLAFSERASEYGDAATRWIKLTVGFAAASAIYVISAYWLWGPDRGLAAADVVGELGSRFLILSLLLFGIGFSARNYAAMRHNELVNLHRLDSLTVFDTFTSGARTDQTRDAVLYEATKAVFSPGTTGYERSKAGNPPSASTTREIVRQITDDGEL